MPIANIHNNTIRLLAELKSKNGQHVIKKQDCFSISFPAQILTLNRTIFVDKDLKLSSLDGGQLAVCYVVPHNLIGLLSSKTKLSEITLT